MTKLLTPQFGLRVQYRLYTCTNCGRDQLIQTNHTDACLDYCGRGDTTENAGCSWKPSFGGRRNAYAGPGGRTYRRFIYVDPTECRPPMYEGWTNSRTWCANLYLEQEREAYEAISAIRKRGEKVTVADVRGWFNRLRLKCDAWTVGPVNWQEIADFYNDEGATMQHRVMMRIDGREVPSSCVKSGALKVCNETAARLNRRKHPRVDWVVLPCIGTDNSEEGKAC